jgi:hypothetical protein
MAGDRLGYQLLVAAGSVRVGAVEEIDAELARPADRRDGAVAVRFAVERGHRRAAEPHRRDLKLPELALLHFHPLSISLFRSAVFRSAGRTI